MKTFGATLCVVIVLCLFAMGTATGATRAQEVVRGGMVQPIAQPETQTVGLFFDDPTSYQGYTLFAPDANTTTYLIDNSGLTVHSWPSDGTTGLAAYLLPSGDLLRTQSVSNPVFTSGGNGGRLKEIAWDGTIAWDYTYSNSSTCQHHDVECLPNGHLLFIAWELKTQSQAVAAGRKPSLVTSAGLWPDTIVEVQPSGAGGGTVVWQWHVWDHLIQDNDSLKANYGVVGDHPELVDLNFPTTSPSADWTHLNAIRYHAAFDQILVSVHNFSEVWIIDHSTTTAQAAGHSGGTYGKGGDLLYRWGNSQAYRQGTSANQMLFGQHDAQWIASGLPGAGDILVFNNGLNRPAGAYTSVDEFTPPVDADGNYTLAPGSAFGPSALTWTYVANPPTSLYSNLIGGAQRQPNGDTLLCSGMSGNFLDVSSNGTALWRYINPVTATGPVAQGTPLSGSNNSVFKIRRYDASYAGLAGRDLNAGCTVETGTTCSFSAAFNYSPSIPNDTTPVAFSAIASGGTLPYNYSWDLAGAAAGGINAARTFGAGSQNITLTVTDAEGDTATSTQILSVSVTPPPPIADGKLAGVAAIFSKDAGVTGQIDVTYGTSPCSSSNAVILYGNLGNFSAYVGCAQSDAGHSGAATISALGLTNVWFNIVWADGTTAGFPGYGFDGTNDVAETWTASGFCAITVDDHSNATCR